MKLSGLLFIAGLFTIATGFISVSPIDKKVSHFPPFQDYIKSTQWADSIFDQLNFEERIGQLFMVAAYSNKDQAHVDEIANLVRDYKIGGLIFFQGGPVRQANLTNYYQSLAKVPLMISIDGEWGLGMRLDSTVSFPKQMTLGAIQNDSLIYEMGAEIAGHCKRIGIHVNLAPVIDVNNNPANPVIGNRSFGENKFNVARKGIAYMKGMQDNGIMANAKHFPGHGDTDSDSHKTLPLIMHTRERIDSIELYPFKQLIENGLGSMMVAHLYIPAFDTTRNTATTLSKIVVTDILQNECKFSGLIFTDALNMQGVSKFFAPGLVDVKALLAGNDVLLFAEDVPTAINEIKNAVVRGEITKEEIEKRCRKILRAKQLAGLNKRDPINTKELYNDLNSKSSEVINRKLTEASLTVLNNKNKILPLVRLDTLKIATLLIGSSEPTVFHETIDLYSKADHFFIEKEAPKEKVDSLFKQLEPYNIVVVSVDGINNNRRKNYGITPGVVDIIRAIQSKLKTIVHLPASPYALAGMKGIEEADAVIVSYEDNDFSKSYSAQLVFGGVAAKGRLPVTASAFYKEGMGLDTEKTRFKYTIPEELMVDSRVLKKIDSIAKFGISQHAYPGCQVLVAKSGHVVYNKSFGYHTYENKIRVKNSDIYDLASITKVAASLAGVMDLHDKFQFSLDDKLCDFLPSLDSCNKNSITLRQLLAHQAGLKDWIPFYLKTINKGEYAPGVYNTEKNEEYPFRVADKLFIHKDFPDSILQMILHSPVSNKIEYKYSDLGYYIIKQIIEDWTKMPLEEYAHAKFYSPLGMITTGYKPRDRFPLSRLVPTEYDMVFRKQLIHGDVHDQGAAMLGGVAGHAGLFSNANDLAKLMQMYMQYGEYGGIRYLSKEILEECIKCQFCENENRRGAGFDRPEMNYGKSGPTCQCVSPMSFGHTGFTGTMAWADPETEIVYIFLSNRVYPDAENKKLAKLNIRTEIQQVIYDAFD